MAYPVQHLDFDEWRILAISDPEGFEAMRRKVLQAAIERAPEKRRQRLQGLQWRIDQVRQRSASPMAACISLSDMMWESFAGDQGLLDILQGRHQMNRQWDGKGNQPVSAKVIQLVKHQKTGV